MQLATLALHCVVLYLFIALNPAQGIRVSNVVDDNPDKITSLPFFNGTIPFNTYSGYITVDPDHGRKLFYWFVESQRNPSQDPLTLWLNGGPGCSSLDGMLYEHGPFHFDRPDSYPPDDTLYLNPNSWNRISNVLYVEAPAGVGFSYSDDPNDYNTNDSRTADDNYAFLLEWFKKYPQFLNNDFYIAGESYAGVYVPTLAYKVVTGNMAGNQQINIKEMLVGNGVTDEVFDAISFVDFAWYHALYPNSLHEEVVQACQGNYSNTSPNCQNIIGQIYQTVGNINIYDIYRTCYQGPSAKPSMGRSYRVEPSSVFNAMASLGEEVPCIDSSVAESYLNRPDVRKALHAEPVSKIGEWSICSDKVNYTKIYPSVLKFYPTLMNNIRVLIYSGDVDASVPYVGSEGWTASLNRPVKSPWTAWTLDNQVAGYVIEYDIITFLTVKGAGHMVPQWKPKQAFCFLSRLFE